jgi:VIT1/CCC1 family predicted Fe2+/Mn2+ transporter
VREVTQIFEGYGLKGDGLKNVIDAITADPRRWMEFMMRFELGLEQPDPRRAPISAATIAIAYLVGGSIPLAPYIAITNIPDALKVSIVLTGIALAIFGAVKGRFTGVNPLKSALQTLLVGGLAAGAAYWLAHLLG